MEFITSMISLPEASSIESSTTAVVDLEKPHTQDMGTFAKAYAIEQLRRNGHNSLAETVTDFKLEGKIVPHLINRITRQFANERNEQLEDIFFELQITEDSLQETFQTISNEMFRNNIKWGRIVSFIAFSGSLVLYCAEHGMQSKVHSVLQWIESYIVEHLSTWISHNGGWEGLVEHFTSQESSVLYSVVPNVFMGFGLATLAIAGGLLAYKKKLLL